MENEVDLFGVMRHALAGERGWGKYHLIKTNSERSLCSVKLRYWRNSNYGHPIEKALAVLSARAIRNRGKNRQACKSCIKRAQKLRNPLDRLAEIQ